VSLCLLSGAAREMKTCFHFRASDDIKMANIILFSNFQFFSRSSESLLRWERTFKCQLEKAKKPFSARENSLHFQTRIYTSFLALFYHKKAAGNRQKNKKRLLFRNSLFFRFFLYFQTISVCREERIFWNKAIDHDFFAKTGNFLQIHLDFFANIALHHLGLSPFLRIKFNCRSSIFFPFG